MRSFALLALCACDAFYGLGQLPTPDADTACVHPFAVYFPPGDLDGDGIDNCHDRCPFDADPPEADDTDTDGDGIPDRCDPDVRGGGTAFPDCVLMFDDFTDNNHPNPLDPRWTNTSADLKHWQWEMCPGSSQLAFCSPLQEQYAVLYFDQALPTASRVQALATVSATHAPKAAFQVFADSGPHDNDLDGRACGFEIDAAESGVTLDDLTKHMIVAEQSKLDVGSYPLGTPVQVQLDPGNNWDCRQLLAGADMADVTATGAPPSKQMQFVGVRAEQADVQVHDIRVYGVNCH